MASPRVSVIILTYNRPQIVGRAVRSVLDQEFQDLEILVVDDSPSAETAYAIREWQCEPRVRYFHRARYGNIAQATNFGLSHARGEYIAILDDDDFWSHPSKLEMQVDFLHRNPEYAACGGGVVLVDRDGTETARYMKPERDERIRRRALVANPMIHSTILYRRSVVENLGGYDETLPGFQDWDLWLRMGIAGKLYNFPAYLACYTIWSGGGSFRQTRKNTSSALRIVWRHRKNYKHFGTALSLALAYHIYAYLPRAVRDASFSFLSRMKKMAFAEQTQLRGTTRPLPKPLAARAAASER